MEASSTIGMGQELSRSQLVKSDTCPPPKFHAIPKIAMKGDSMGALSSILPKFIIIHDVKRFYMCNIEEVGDYKIREAYDNLCNEGILKVEFKVVERKGLTCALELLKNFKIEWIKIILRKIHDIKY